MEVVRDEGEGEPAFFGGLRLMDQLLRLVLLAGEAVADLDARASPGHCIQRTLARSPDTRRVSSRRQRVEAQPLRSSKSGDLAAEVIQDAQRLVSLEIALAKQEVKELAI